MSGHDVHVHWRDGFFTPNKNGDDRSVRYGNVGCFVLSYHDDVELRVDDPSLPCLTRPPADVVVGAELEGAAC